MNGHPWNRLLASAIDWLCILVWVGVVASIGVPLYVAGITGGLSTGAQNVLGTVVLVVPMTLMLTGFESSAREASIGKRVRHLIVVNSDTGQRVSFRRALVRNTMKLAVPWTVGHAAVYGIVAASATDSISPAIWVVTAFAYVVPLVYVASLFLGSGRTLYDRISGTTARPSARWPFPFVCRVPCAVCRVPCTVE
ncbi:RDD family protein [Cryobacterium sp. MLB-32]|uniref:RDD family protein n=1 Tax=Cryobacterium sp. MLB-32 TaxID=1529318 RepID=UPI00068CCFE4|nr:RDD family protein [Cryobacterium sp. MLB-32]